MMERLLLSDLKEEIAQMQYEISATYAPPALPSPRSSFPPQLIKTPLTYRSESSDNSNPASIHSELRNLPVSKLSPSCENHPQNNNTSMFPLKSSQFHPLIPSPHSRDVIKSKLNPSIPSPPDNLSSCMHQSSTLEKEEISNSSDSIYSNYCSPGVIGLISSKRPLRNESRTSELKRFKRAERQSSPSKPVVADKAKDTVENFDIESELTPNFIMKKVTSNIAEGPVLKHINANISICSSNNSSPSEIVAESPAAMGIEYFAASYQKKSDEEEGDKETNDENSESYDEWLCIQKALEEHNTRPLGHHLDIRKPIVSPLPSDIFPSSSPKVVAHHFSDIFSAPDNSIGNTNAPSPLSELFNSDHGSNKPQLDLFNDNEAGVVKNGPDTVESRLEALFEGTNTESEDALDNASFLHKNPEMSYEMVQALQVSVASSKQRQWNSNCTELIDSNDAAVNSNLVYSKRQCVTAAFNDNSDASRWMMDCQQETFEFESISSCESSSQKGQSQEINGSKRIWNADILDGSGGDSNKPTMPQIPHNRAHDAVLSHHHHHHHPELSQSQQQIHHHTTNLHNDANYDHLEGATVNFDEEISQQVQNAIDSILNLQSIDGDFSLDQTIGSLLNENPSLQHLQHQRPPSATKRKYNPHHSQSNVNENHQVNDIGGCLIGGSGHTSSLDDSPTCQSLAQAGNSDSNTSLSDNFGSGIDDTVKSIMTS